MDSLQLVLVIVPNGMFEVREMNGSFSYRVLSQAYELETCLKLAAGAIGCRIMLSLQIEAR